MMLMITLMILIIRYLSPHHDLLPLAQFGPVNERSNLFADNDVDGIGATTGRAVCDT
jgi:hypothetical protein